MWKNCGPKLRWTILLPSVLLLASPCARAQTAAGDTLTLRLGTQLVLVDASVQRKKTGESIEGLTPADFVLTEDGEAQSISSLSEDQLPLSIVLLFDLTDSVHPVLTHLADGAAAVLKHLRPQDEIAVMTFSSQTRLVQGFTHDRMTAVEGIDDASATYDRNEPTFLFEDLWEASKQTERTRIRDARRVEIWITDGSANDQIRERSLARHAPASLHTDVEADEALLHSNAVVSALIERGGQPLSSGRYGDIERYAQLTGGPVVQGTASDVGARLAAMLDDLRERYTLGFKPSQPRPEGTLCRLKLSLSPAFFAGHPKLKARDVSVRSRESYVRQIAR